MKNEKKGFVFYFDNYPILEKLSPEQRGWLLSTLCVYADRLRREGEVDIGETLMLFPQLLPQTRVACEFIGATILRDTRRWLKQREARGRKTSIPSLPEPSQSLQQEREDMERARRLLEGMRAKGKTLPGMPE